ncbi:hypothetical protein NS220_06075 [Microbacterium testaceum]|uniref:Uncharacterized protein n=1 Tax=Microbacterium testaceum TaxID=2033 RepID=A0A147EYR9_MICTE|nr:hypothetical protein [Microbacterium testaceum]KTR95368.1 hypothetical protein NS220_06075 [Microbacterium testaceum]
MATAKPRRTQVEAIDNLAAEIRLHTEVVALSLPVAVLRHDDKNYTNPVTKAEVEEKNRRRAAVRAALGWEQS